MNKDGDPVLWLRLGANDELLKLLGALGFNGFLTGEEKLGLDGWSHGFDKKEERLKEEGPWKKELLKKFFICWRSWFFF